MIFGAERVTGNPVSLRITTSSSRQKICVVVDYEIRIPPHRPIGPMIGLSQDYYPATDDRSSSR